MPQAQTIRRWLWRLNGVTALVVVLVGAWALFGDFETALISIPAQENEPAAVETTTTWEEIVAVFRRHYGDPDAKPAPPPQPPAPVSDGRLPLRAFRLTCFYWDPDGNHGALLKSKDPAHPELFLPGVGRPHKGVAIERVFEERGITHVVVRRSEESFTFELVDQEPPRSGRFRVVPRHRPGAAPDAGGEYLVEAGSSPTSPDVKLVPFYADDGSLLGGRVTGVRPGSRLARAGLEPGDVVVELDGERSLAVSDQRRRLNGPADLGGISVIRGPRAEIRQISLGG